VGDVIDESFVPAASRSCKRFCYFEFSNACRIFAYTHDTQLQRSGRICANYAQRCDAAPLPTRPLDDFSNEAGTINATVVELLVAQACGSGHSKSTQAAARPTNLQVDPSKCEGTFRFGFTIASRTEKQGNWGKSHTNSLSIASRSHALRIV
jgi:hypothetical protein